MMRTTLKTAAALALATPVLALAACGTQHATVRAPAPPPASTQQDTPAPPPDTPPDTPSGTPSTPDTFGLPVGTSITMTDGTSGAAWDVTLNSVRPFSPGPYDTPPPRGQHDIIIDVTYSATAGPVDVNEWDWTAKDPSGLVSEVQSVFPPNSLSATTIQTGGKIRGVVVLTAADGSGGTVVYSSGLSERASWVFAAAQS